MKSSSMMSKFGSGGNDSVVYRRQGMPKGNQGLYQLNLPILPLSLPPTPPLLCFPPTSLCFSFGSQIRQGAEAEEGDKHTHFLSSSPSLTPTHKKRGSDHIRALPVMSAAQWSDNQPTTHCALGSLVKTLDERRMYYN